jgi:succinate dehydrogenase / fumarate reductase iron-sulfur subunit
MVSEDKKKLLFSVFRFNSETDYLPYYDKFEIEVKPGEVVLDILNRIKWEHDGSFSYRRSCRHGICGSCAVKVNGKATLACKDRVSDLEEIFGDELVIEPQDQARVIKDMVIDKADFWKKYDTVEPYLKTEIDEAPTAENLVSPELAEEIDEADYCIQCGNCYYSCPAVAVNEDYLGPAALALTYRFNADVRDEGKRDRLETVNQIGPGIWDCVKCFECAEACPKEINPIEKITKLHNMQFEQGVAVSNIATRHAEGFVRSIRKHGFLDEADIVVYSEGYLGMYKHLKTAVKMLKAGKIHWNDALPWVDNVPKSKNLDEIQKLIDISMTNKL